MKFEKSKQLLVNVFLAEKRYFSNSITQNGNSYHKGICMGSDKGVCVWQHSLWAGLGKIIPHDIDQLGGVNTRASPTSNVYA